MHRLRLSREGMFFCTAACALLVMPWRFVLSAVCAAGMHELFHWLAVRYLGEAAALGTPGLHAIRMEAPAMPWPSAAVCLLAGPVGSLSVLLLPGCPVLHLCGLVQCCYNLLPIEPLDGGRLLHLLLAQHFPAPLAARITQRIGLAAALFSGFLLTAAALKLHLPGLLLGLLPLLSVVQNTA